MFLLNTDRREGERRSQDPDKSALEIHSSILHLVEQRAASVSHSDGQGQKIGSKKSDGSHLSMLIGPKSSNKSKHNCHCFTYFDKNQKTKNIWIFLKIEDWNIVTD